MTFNNINKTSLLMTILLMNGILSLNIVIFSQSGPNYDIQTQNQKMFEYNDIVKQKPEELKCSQSLFDTSDFQILFEIEDEYSGFYSNIQSYDIDNDTKNELIYSIRTTDKDILKIYELNVGSLDLEYEEILSTSSERWPNIAIGDSDKDGLTEIWWGSNPIKVYEVDNENYLRNVQNFSGLYTVGKMGNFDGDNNMDVLISSSSTLYNYENTGNNQWIKKELFRVSTDWGLEFVQVADMDKDGAQEILITQSWWQPEGQILIYENTGDDEFTFRYKTPQTYFYGSQATVVGDYDQDGYSEFIVTDSDGGTSGLWIYECTGNNQWRLQENIQTDKSRGRRTTKGNFFGNEEIEIVSSEYLPIGNVSIWNGENKVIWSMQDIEAQFYGVSSTNLDNSGYDELIISSLYEQKVWVYGNSQEFQQNNYTDDDPYEENDNSGETFLLDYGEYDHLILADEDWFSFQVYNGTTIKIETYFNHTENDLDFTVFDTLNGEVGGSYGIENNESIELYCYETGQWKIRIYSASGYNTIPGKYNLTINNADDWMEDNDELQYASWLDVPGEWNNLWQGDNDYYQFHAPAGTIHIEVECIQNILLSMKLLYANTLGLVGEDRSTDDGLLVIDFTYDSDRDYIIEIAGDNSFNWYNLRISFDSSNTSGTDDNDDSGNSDSSTENPISDNDFSNIPGYSLPIWTAFTFLAVAVVYMRIKRRNKN